MDQTVDADIQVEAKGLTKEYRVPVREGGVRASVSSLFRRKYRTVVAAADVSFQIRKGEMVGFLGPNGAGKTTTLKMLSGLLYPTRGEATVMGYVPWQRDFGYLRRMTLVMGQKNQLIWDIPAMDTFLLNQAIYNIPEKEFRASLADFTEHLGLEGLLDKPVRNLSLGERMKCELAAALLHKPKVLFLDEPTLGLDVSMQNRIRAFIKEYNQRYEASILLTSHYMADIAALCERVIMIHQGRLVYDGRLQHLVGQMAPYKVLHVMMNEGVTRDQVDGMGEILDFQEGKLSIKLPKDRAPEVTSRLLSSLPIIDLTVEDPPIEDVIEQAFREGVTA